MAILIPLKYIFVHEDRTRKDFAPQPLAELESDILENGLINPITVHQEDVDGTSFSLHAGERRWRSISNLHAKGLQVRHGDGEVPYGLIPATVLVGKTKLELLSIEISENLKRVDLSWQERTDALAKLHQLRLATNPDQTPADTGAEVAETMDVTPKYATNQVARSLVLSANMEDPVVAKAKTESEAWTALQQKLNTQFKVALEKKVKEDARPSNPPATGSIPPVNGAVVDVPKISIPRHRLIHGDCLDILPTLPHNHYSVLLCDPPYGIQANKMTRQKTARHFYDDSEENAIKIAKGILERSYPLLQSEACVFMFCTPNLWHVLHDMCEDMGYAAWHRPVIWQKSLEGLAPWGNKGFTYTYEMILYATKGRRGMLDGHVDILNFPRSQRGKLHGAQKPVTLYEFLLRRSAYAGDHILDPCCGSGTIFPAANRSGLIATGIEMNLDYYNVSKSRLDNDTVHAIDDTRIPDPELDINPDFDILGDERTEDGEGPDSWGGVE